MARALFTLLILVALATWAAGQHPGTAAAPAPEDQLRLLRANRSLIGNLVSEGVEMANTSHSTAARVEHCRRASRSLINAILQAAERGDAERVVMLTNLFGDFVRDGLSPLLEEVKARIDPQSPEGERLGVIQQQARADLQELKLTLTTGAVRDNQRVQESLKQLDELTPSGLPRPTVASPATN
ncbi:MAG: hypothetical protein RMJ56_18425 [Gemmataceae bacterium]|nr:hypothetical protein [Gemmata sp.]MDW8199574.1 hypothetical protein [Gemmataceae bacterium]